MNLEKKTYVVRFERSPEVKITESSPIITYGVGFRNDNMVAEVYLGLNVVPLLPGFYIITAVIYRPGKPNQVWEAQLTPKGFLCYDKQRGLKNYGEYKKGMMAEYFKSSYDVLPGEDFTGYNEALVATNKLFDGTHGDPRICDFDLSDLPDIPEKEIFLELVEYLENELK